MDLIEPFFSIASFNMTEENVNEIYTTGKFLKEKGINKFNISPSLNFGRAEINNLSYNNETLLEMQKQLRKIENIYPNYVKIDSELIDKAKKGQKCGAGTDTITITPNGDVKPCPIANIDDFYLGNIFNEMPYDNISKIRELDIPQEKYCKNCEYTNFCLNCFVRGMKQYTNIGDKCKWGVEVMQSNDQLIKKLV
ncbi:MAG: SPASM domain-containing protein [Methanobrevibacter sp.]|nr:SPASM domain-containing protein [Methanobrevibacter sp.]